MGRRTNNFTIHQFYCMNCGNRGIDLPRKSGQKRERFHKKKMYCFKCREEINHIECKTEEEAQQFKIDFENGVYINEAKESLAYVRNTRLGKINLCKATN